MNNAPEKRQFDFSQVVKGFDGKPVLTAPSQRDNYAGGDEIPFDNMIVQGLLAEDPTVKDGKAKIIRGKLAEKIALANGPVALSAEEEVIVRRIAEKLPTAVYYSLIRDVMGED